MLFRWFRGYNQQLLIWIERRCPYENSYEIPPIRDIEPQAPARDPSAESRSILLILLILSNCFLYMTFGHYKFNWIYLRYDVWCYIMSTKSIQSPKSQDRSKVIIFWLAEIEKSSLSISEFFKKFNVCFKIWVSECSHSINFWRTIKICRFIL